MRCQLRAWRPKKIMPAPTAMAITPAMLGMGMVRCWSAVTLSGPASITTFFSVKEMLSMSEAGDADGDQHDAEHDERFHRGNSLFFCRSHDNPNAWRCR